MLLLADTADDGGNTSIEVLQNPVQGKTMPVWKIRYRGQDQWITWIAMHVKTADSLTWQKPSNAAPSVASLQECNQLSTVAPLRELIEMRTMIVQ
jgi:hypothetical protein